MMGLRYASGPVEPFVDSRHETDIAVSLPLAFPHPQSLDIDATDYQCEQSHPHFTSRYLFRCLILCRDRYADCFLCSKPPQICKKAFRPFPVVSPSRVDLST